MLKFNLSKEAANILNKTTDYSYIVNIRTQIIRDEIGPLEFETYEDGENKTEIEISVYYIPSGNLIYNQKTIASSSIDKGEKNTFISTAHSLTFKALKKALRNIKNTHN